jgi:hypothetical protein
LKKLLPPLIEHGIDLGIEINEDEKNILCDVEKLSRNLLKIHLEVKEMFSKSDNAIKEATSYAESLLLKAATEDVDASKLAFQVWSRKQDEMAAKKAEKKKSA